MNSNIIDDGRLEYIWTEKMEQHYQLIQDFDTLVWYCYKPYSGSRDHYYYTFYKGQPFKFSTEENSIFYGTLALLNNKIASLLREKKEQIVHLSMEHLNKLLSNPQYTSWDEVFRDE